MSVADVQARTASLQARLTALAGGTPLSGAAPLAGGVVGKPFAAALTEAQATTTTAAAMSRAGSATGAAAVALAKEQIGTPYVFGGTEPGGFDCSGLIQWTYGKLGVDLPRHSTDQGRAGVEVSATDAQPGDLVYFDRPGSVDHIGIYQGDGKWVVAPKTGDVVKVQDVDLQKATSIRRVVGTASPAPAPAAGWATALPAGAQRYGGLIGSAAASAGIDPKLLTAVAWTESAFDPQAQSGAGAQGLMQLMPRTAQALGVDALDPAQALQGGARYLRQQLDAFGGRADLALAAYNAGPTAVRKARGIPPYAETQSYVEKVLSRFAQLGGTP